MIVGQWRVTLSGGPSDGDTRRVDYLPRAFVVTADPEHDNRYTLTAVDRDTHTATYTWQSTTVPPQ